MPTILSILTAPFRLFTALGGAAVRRVGGWVMRAVAAKGFEKATGKRPPTVAEAAGMPIAKGVAVAVGVGAVGGLFRLLIGRMLRHHDRR